jgi:hypothetical protein
MRCNATGAPAEVASRAGNSVAVLNNAYTHCVHGHEGIVSQRIGHALNQQNLSPPVTASGSPDRLLCPDPVRYMSVIIGSTELTIVYRSAWHRRFERVADADPVEPSRRSA